MDITPLNGPWWAFVAFIALLGFGIHFALRGRDQRTKKRWLFGVALANLGASITFHVTYLTDPTINFPLFQNLPFHLCTIMSWLMPLVVLKDWRALRAVAFFPGALAGILALYSCAPMYWYHPLFSLYTCFFVAHAMNAVIPFLLASLRLYRPTSRDAVMSLAYVVTLALSILPVTLGLRLWVDPHANYFYVFDPEGAQILQVLHDWIGIPIVYLVPLLLLVLPILLAEVGVYHLATRSRRELRESPREL